jgi:hypothetical protein
MNSDIRLGAILAALLIGAGYLVTRPPVAPLPAPDPVPIPAEPEPIRLQATTHFTTGSAYTPEPTLHESLVASSNLVQIAPELSPGWDTADRAQKLEAW